ncbi:MAG: hypothetical protein E2P02_30805 [Acidobacteria bacterium]|nr:MAG: hypothetical protein E2P02_30805 [Acidobacteriota bacterium]
MFTDRRVQPLVKRHSVAVYYQGPQPDHCYQRWNLLVNTPHREYYRGDRAAGVTAPNLSKEHTYAEHVVRARGKRSQFTSLSLDRLKIHDFGDTTYQVLRDTLDDDAHELVEHERLLEELRRVATESDKAGRARAIQAIRYSKRRKEGLVNWRFDISGIDRKDLVTWAFRQLKKYFRKV